MANQFPRRALVHIAIFVTAIVVISLIAIWFNLGPVVHSQGTAFANLKLGSQKSKGLH